jgi:hypothetical protein
MNGRQDNFTYISRQPEGNMSRGRPRRRWEDNNCILRLHTDGCGLVSSRSGHGPVATLVSRN